MKDSIGGAEESFELDDDDDEFEIATLDSDR